MTTSTIRKFEPLFPVKHPDLFSLYNQAVQSFWTAQEIDMASDDIQKLSDAERHILATVLSFFAASDLIVNENIAENMYKLATYPEAKMFLAFQSAYAINKRIPVAIMCKTTGKANTVVN